MIPHALDKKVDALLNALDSEEPEAIDLGTPDLTSNEIVLKLIALGSKVVPILIEQIKGQDSKKRIAYIITAIDYLKDIRALQPLLDLRAKYQQLDKKDEWDFAIIGQCNLAIARLRED